MKNILNKIIRFLLNKLKSLFKKKKKKKCGYPQAVKTEIKKK